MNRQGCRYAVFIAVACGLLAGCRTAPRQVDVPPVPSDAHVVAGSLPQPEDLASTGRHDPSLQLAAYQAEGDPYEAATEPPQPEYLPRPGVPENVPVPTDPVSHGGPLQLEEVIQSVQQSYPLLVEAMLERNIADGNQVAAQGEFDLKLKAYGIAEPLGYYQTYRNAIGLEQPLPRGGYAFGGYKLGVGDFPTWYGERETNDAGEFSAGFGIPLLKDRLIDKRRAGVLQTEWARQAVEPALQAQLLEFVRIASRFYWMWVAAGRSLEAQRELLQNAQARVRQIQEKVDAGDLPRIARINNEQLIAARETKVIEAERKLQEAAIKLSLFVRDYQGQPLVPDSSRLPASFPAPESPASAEVQVAIQQAVAASPVIAGLDFLAEQVRVDLQTAENSLLPKLDARLLAAKDIGGPASSKRDKSPFQLEVGLYGEVPLQRRAARGKIAAAEAKLAQINAKRQFVANKVTAAVQDAVSALQASADRIARADTNLDLATETLRLGRLQFDAGDTDLVTLNIYEKSVADAQLLRIAAYADFFIALADYRAALAMDPYPSP